MHPAFEILIPIRLRPETFDLGLSSHPEKIVGVFFWGENCPNCEIAKRSLLENQASLLDLGIQWFHVNTYEDMDLGVRFGLFGIPTFLFFKNGKKLGRISPYPGFDPFHEALAKLVNE